MKLLKKSLYLLLFSCLLSELSWSATTIIAFSAGPAWYRTGQTQTLNLQPNFANTYAATTPQKILGSGELFVGVQQLFPSLGFGRLGLALAGSTHASLQGGIWETGDPQFENFTYQYKISHVHLAAKTKWLCTHWSASLLPYVSASLGVAANKAYGFSMTSLLFEALPVANFENHETIALTYTVGTGVHKVLNPHWQIGIGYEFGDWGHAALSPSSEQTTNSGLSLNHLYTQQLQFTINYLF